MNEKETIERCKQQKAKAQELVYSTYANRLFRLGLRYLKSDADTEDVLIIAFSKIFKNIASFHYQGEGSLEAWMRRIVINEALMWLRSKHNFNLTESIESAEQETALTEFSNLEAEDIYRLITLLPTGYRTVFNLSVIEGYSHQEIAEALTITEGTSRSQLFKAKAQLKKMLTKEGFNYGT